MSDYDKAKKLGLTSINRWGVGIHRFQSHHPMSKRLMDFLSDHDFKDYNDHFCWKTGGDGDNGESLMFEMDAFFELLDAENAEGEERISLLSISEEEFRRDSSKYMSMALSDTMIVIEDKDGKAVLVLGRGPDRPETEEDKAETDRFFNELKEDDE